MGLLDMWIAQWGPCGLCPLVPAEQPHSLTVGNLSPALCDHWSSWDYCDLPQTSAQGQHISSSFYCGRWRPTSWSNLLWLSCIFSYTPFWSGDLFSILILIVDLVAGCGKPFLLVQKKVKIAGLWKLSQERPACMVGPWLVSGNLALVGAHHSLNRFPHRT